MSKEPKHHYIPCFYLKQWALNGGRLVEFSRQGNHNFVKARYTSPKGTGYVRGLNLIPGVSAETAGHIEEKFFQLVDEWAARALAKLLDKKEEPSGKERAGWARFIYALIVRTPEHIEVIRAKSPEYKITLPPQALLPTLINSERVITEINQMSWYTADFTGIGKNLLTSDRPIIMTNGLAQDDAHIALPISPTRLFIAVRQQRTFEDLKSLDLIQITNAKVCEQAIKYVFASMTAQLYFVAGHLGKKVRSTPLG